MNNDSSKSQLEERLAIQRTITAYLIAHLVQEGLVNLNAARDRITAFAQLSGCHEKALDDIDEIFGMAAISIDLHEKEQHSQNWIDE